MKKILFGLLVLISFQSFGQNPTNYQYRVVRERLIAMMVDSGFHVPRYNGTPTGVRSGVWVGDGAVAVDTTNHIFYYYSGGVWRTLSGDNIYNSNGILEGNRTITGLNNTYYLRFDSLASWRVGRDGVARFSMGTTTSSMNSQNGSAVFSANTASAIMNFGSNAFTALADSFQATKIIAYEPSYVNGMLTPRALTPKYYVDSLVAAGGSNISNADLTSDANHTLDLNGFTQTITGGTWLHDSVRFTNTILYPTPDSLIAYGNSITTGSNASPGDSAYIERYVDLLGLTLDNKAVGGRGAWRATSEANAAENPGHTKMATIMAGFNDVRRGGSDARTFNKVINAHKNIFINHFLRTYQSAGNGADVTRYGTWATNYPASTIGGKSVSLGAYTQVLNDSIVYSFTDDNVVFTMIFGDGTTEEYSSSFEIYIDGVLQSTGSALYGTDAISDGADGNTRQPAGFIYTGLSYGSHTLKVINKDGGSGDHMIIDYFGHLVTPNNAYPFVIWHSPKMDATGYATAPANATDAIIDSLNAKIDSLVATFPSDYPVYVAETNSYYVNTTASGDLDVADHIHPTNQGHRHIYDAGVAAFGSFPVYAGTPRTVFWSGGRPWAWDSVGSARQLAYKDEGAQVAGSNKQVQYNNNGSMGGGTGFEYGNTNNLVLIQSPAVGNAPLITKGFAGQTAAHYQAQSSSGTPLYLVDASGGVQILGTFAGTPIGSGSLEMEYAGGQGYISSYSRGGASWQDLNLRADDIILKSNNVNKVTVGTSRISLLDSVYATDKIPYNSSAGIVHLGIDTVAASPTFGKLVRKTAGGATPTLQQVLTAGATTTGNNTIINGSNTLEVTNNSLTAKGFTISSTYTGATSFTQKLFNVELAGANAASSVISRAVTISNGHSGTSSTNYGIDLAATNGTTNIGQQITAGSGTTNQGLLVSITTNSATNDGIRSEVQGTSSTNTAGYFKAISGSANYALVTDGGNVGFGTATPSATALLELVSTTQGLLLPRMTKTQRDAIGSPVAGLMVYQTDNTPGLRVYNGTNWMRFTETAD